MIRGARFRQIVFACTLVLAPRHAMAQKATAFSLPITVDVANGLSVFTERSLDFGTVLAGSGTATVPLTSASNGLFRINGRNNRTVNVTLSPPASLVNGANSIPYTWQAASNDNANDVGTATVRATTGFQVQLKDHISGSTSNGWVWIYGSINLGTMPSTLPGGLYQGTFVITVAY